MQIPFKRAVALNMKTGGSDVIVEWQVPTKEGLVASFVVNWPAINAHDFTVSPPISVAQFYEAFQRTFGKLSTLPADVQDKYINTVKFINIQLAKHAEV